MAKDANSFHNPDWLELQRQFLESLNPAAGGGEASEQADWQRSMEEWWAAVTPLIPEESKAVFNSVVNQSRSFLSLYDQFARMLRDVAGVADGDEEWQPILQQHIDEMKSEFDAVAGLDRETESLSGAWLASLEAWRQAFLFMPPDEILGGVQGDQLRQLSERLLALPALGPFRGQYQALQEGTRLWQAYQDKCREYRNVFYRLGKQGLDRLQEKILQMGRENRTITSLRQLYDLWVESNEEVFSGYAASEEYSILYGELVGAFMRFRRHSLKLLEDMFSQLDLPGGRSVGGLGREQKALYEALRSSREEQQQLRSTVEELRREVERLRDSMTGGGNDDDADA